MGPIHPSELAVVQTEKAGPGRAMPPAMALAAHLEAGPIDRGRGTGPGLQDLVGTANLKSSHLNRSYAR